MSAAPVIVWFRRDLRLADHPPLAEAVRRGGGVIPLFVLDDALWGPAGVNRRWFLAGALADLLGRTDGALVVRRGDPAEVLGAVAAATGASAVLVSEDFGPYGRGRDERVEAALAGAGVGFERIGSPYVVDPGTVLTGGGTPYRVFTPFFRAWRQRPAPDPWPAPAGVNWVHGVPGDGPPAPPAVRADLPEPTEAAAHRRLARFCDLALARYDGDRDRPDLDGTSRLSPYLRWGLLHPRQVLAAVAAAPAGGSRGAEVFRSEIAWREFYADVLFHAPGSARRALRAELAGIRLDEGPAADERFAAWADGRTGVPIVDAGMRQLRAEGWMHNRVRMIVASFLVKDLHLDWRRGARHFMAHLVDGDLASNQHGWQWVAGTGTDAAPYFRVFNPVTQGRRFDPDGEYLRRYVPELAGLDRRAVHEPWTAAADLFGSADGPGGYPPPIVDHAEERREALRRYSEAREDPG